jgi:predicted amidohydrolase
MRVALLQSAPTLGAVDRNIQSANDILAAKFPATRLNGNREKKVDLLILPELALTGYNFKSPDDIAPYLERKSQSPTTKWAKEVAQRYHCQVLVGLPTEHEKQRRNAAVLVDSRGNVIHEYQKHHMFETDSRWGCTSGPGFSSTTLEVDGQRTRLSVGICMDLNPWEFKAPFEAYEYANYILEEDISLILVPMAWLLPAEKDPTSLEPSQSTLIYWVGRLHPLIDDSRVRTVVICNRTGREGNAVYAGTSCVLRIGKGEVVVLGHMGREEGILDVNVAL